MGLIFFGTPEFAVPSLKVLLENEIVSLVITQPQKFRRDGTPIPIPVKELAIERNIPVLQPERIKNPEFINILKRYQPEFIIVVAYGKILPPEILRIPERYAINVHASLLPKYRGAAPIQWSIINGERITGITTMVMDEGLDTGNILLQEKIEIGEDEDAVSLSKRLSELGAGLLLKTINEIRKGNIIPRPQVGEPSYAPPLKKEDGLINWKRSAREIYNLIRGTQPWPCAYTFLEGERLIITKASVIEGKGEPGRIESTEKAFIIGTGEGLLNIVEIKPEGKRAMDGVAFLRGRRLQRGVILGK
ncbi:MAG: methionyl-tRNA formyltransferase [Thermodesulfovibrionales bacterium]|nr:methionyl-tRNA formyltransferase [Thermodesulfovibrionales bacterium]